MWCGQNGMPYVFELYKIRPFISGKRHLGCSPAGHTARDWSPVNRLTSSNWLDWPMRETVIPISPYPIQNEIVQASWKSAAMLHFTSISISAACNAQKSIGVSEKHILYSYTDSFVCVCVCVRQLLANRCCFNPFHWFLLIYTHESAYTNTYTPIIAEVCALHDNNNNTNSLKWWTVRWTIHGFILLLHTLTQSASPYTHLLAWHHIY